MGCGRSRIANDTYFLIGKKNAASTIGATHWPQCQRGKIRRTAHGGPGLTITGVEIPRLPLTTKIDEQLSVGRHVALVRIKTSAEPLAAFEGIARGVPESNAPPTGRPAPQNHTGVRLTRQQHAHPAGIVEERR